MKNFWRSFHYRAMVKRNSVIKTLAAFTSVFLILKQMKALQRKASPNSS